MDIVTLGAALNGSAEYVNSHFKGGSNIQIVNNPDGTQTINASGEVSAEDTVARADIAAIKDGESLDSFADVETALDDKADSDDVDAALSGKVDKVSGKGLSTNDYTNTEKTKLAGIAEGAEVNVQANWTQTTTTADDYIKNKPTLGTAAALNVAASGNASTSQVVKGNDTRLTDARNAADVSSWAKAANKPSYNGSEIALTGYAEAQSKSSVAATDTTNAAIGKLEYRVETNENNISSIQQVIEPNIMELSWTIKFPANTSSKVGTTTPIYLESGKTYSINNTYSYQFTVFIDGYSSVSVDIPSGQTKNFTPSNSGYLRLYTSYASANTSAIIKVSRKEEKTDELQLYYIDNVSAENHFSTFSDCIKSLKYNNTEKNIYVAGGVYDVYSEIGGSTFLATLSGNENWYDVNDIVPPNTTIIGVGNVVLEMKLPSTTSNNVAKLLSPLNVRGTCSVENINIVAQNCRYCIHDETSGNAEFTGAVKKYRNVVCEKLTSTVGYPQAYAAGFDDDMVLEFKNCVFKSYGEAWSAHNRSSSIDHSSKIIINNSAFASSDVSSRAIRFGNMNKTQEKVEVMICNSYLSNDVLVRDEYTTTGLINAFAITMINCGVNCDITTSINDYVPEIYDYRS